MSTSAGEGSGRPGGAQLAAVGGQIKEIHEVQAGYPFVGTVWTERVDHLTNDAVDPQSASMIETLAAHNRESNVGTTWLNHGDFNTRYYQADNETPRVSLGFHDCQDKGAVPNEWEGWTENVPVDPKWQGADGTDATVIIHDKTKGELYSLWQFKGGSNPAACWGGKIAVGVDAQGNGGTTPGVYQNRGGATATSLPIEAGSISPSDIEAARKNGGDMGHALYIAPSSPRAGVWSCPATRTDGDHEGTAVMEGQRMRFIMSDEEIASLPTEFQRIVAKTGVVRGFIVADKTGRPNPTIISTVDDDTYWDSYLPEQEDGSLAALPWHDPAKFQVLKPNTLCTNAPADEAQGGSWS